MEFAFELGRRERKRQAVHQNLLVTASALFSQHGVQRTTVDDIAVAADVARQTVFNHFPHKEAIVLELVAKELDSAAARAQALLDGGTPALEVLQLVSAWVLDRMVQQGEFAVIVAQELLHADQDRAQRAADLLPLTALFEALLMQAREEGTVRSDIPPSVMAARLTTILRSILLEVRSHDRDGLTRELSICFDMILNGIRDRRL